MFIPDSWTDVAQSWDKVSQFAEIAQQSFLSAWSHGTLQFHYFWTIIDVDCVKQTLNTHKTTVGKLLRHGCTIGSW